MHYCSFSIRDGLEHLILIILIINIMTSVFHWFFMWKMDPMSGCDIRLVFTLLPRDSTLQYKKCVQLWNNFPYITPLTYMKSDRVNLVAPASSFKCLALLTQSPGDTVQTGTRKVDPARKFKCTTTAREMNQFKCLL